jgi:CheY-like chemotaxis protein
MRHIVVTMLRQFGVTFIREAPSGAEALHLMQSVERPFDVVLADQHMNLVGGVQLLELMKAEGIESTFILMAAEANQTVVIEARKQGAKAVLAKPFSTSALISALNRVAASLPGSPRRCALGS